MPSLTIRHIPDHLMRQLREAAMRQRRSLNQEVITLLESAVVGHTPSDLLQARITGQIEAWEGLGGRWADVDEELVDQLYKSRSAGRPVDL